MCYGLCEHGYSTRSVEDLWCELWVSRSSLSVTATASTLRYMEEAHKGAAEAGGREKKKHRRVLYPWKALVFIMGNAMGQRYARLPGLTCRVWHSLI